MFVTTALFGVLLFGAAPASAPSAKPVPQMTEVPAAPDAPMTVDAPGVDGRKLLIKCEKQFLKLETIKGTIRDRVVHLETAEKAPVQETTSDFLYKRFDSVRFENLVPVPHSVIWNGKMLWINSPQENAVVQEPAEKVPFGARAALSLTPGFGIDHLAAIPLDEYKADVKRIVGTGREELVVTLTPVDLKTPRATMQLVVDPEKLVVTRILSLVSEGLQVSDVQMSNVVLAAPGVWFATRVHTRSMLGDGTMAEQLRTYDRLKFNVPIDDSRFTFSVPEGVKVVPLSNLQGARPVQ